jgi:hypothetical protein
MSGIGLEGPYFVGEVVRGSVFKYSLCMSNGVPVYRVLEYRTTHYLSNKIWTLKPDASTNQENFIAHVESRKPAFNVCDEVFLVRAGIGLEGPYFVGEVVRGSVFLAFEEITHSTACAATPVSIPVHVARRHFWTFL